MVTAIRAVEHTALTPSRHHGRVTGLAALLDAGDVLVLTGAGISTDSGIPDYRGPTGALRRHAPMTYQAFVGDPVARRRYWARSYLGWAQIALAEPNAGHHAVAALQRAGALHGVVTQNVDGLHQAAGATDVVELHGGLDRTVCLDCGDRRSRGQLDARLRELNADFAAQAETINPDGDVDIADDALTGFILADCLACGCGRLKPDVVFFGENVPVERVRHTFDLVAQARSMLVLGSSLTVFSGYRFVRAAHRSGLPVAIVNQGPTRADDLAAIRIDAPIADVLGHLPRRVTDARAE
jgi:NAD-dependent SIR2 family protein deacetylase